MEWHYKTRIQEFYQALASGVVLSELERTRGMPGGKRKIKEVMQRGGYAASCFQNIVLEQGSFTRLRDSEVDVCFELDREAQIELRLQSVHLEKMVSVGVTPKQFESVSKDLKYGFNRRYEKVVVEQRQLSL